MHGGESATFRLPRLSGVEPDWRLVDRVPPSYRSQSVGHPDLAHSFMLCHPPADSRRLIRLTGTVRGSILPSIHVSASEPPRLIAPVFSGILQICLDYATKR